ncbi:dihydrofolate reductase family protein [Streptomyces guryensis]|uniref:Dihydrofolate reductase family protein n=1 Tax=Streptomyces guryensis TaxID=2886947 RepID=A0A9Q3Z6K7_9ACTN|nr:dihydrofolate reductase family protein [Streptomyces guryensis]MCD9877091.1 dihydrofolate reductase family protein [Streptomyces guryensis]
MGKIVISSNVTLDGVVQDPDGEEGFERGGWFHQYVEAKDLEDWVARETQEALDAEALLLGARSSEWFADRMTTRNEAEGRVSPEWADRMRSLPKYIVTSTPEDPQWSNATVLDGDVVKEISELKRNVDGEILVYGSYQLVRTLIEHNLADELRLAVFPVLLGSGLRIFDETSEKKPLHLVDTRRLGEGLVFCTYEFVQGRQL